MHVSLADTIGCELREIKLAKLRDYARAHSFAAYISGDCVIVPVPWFNSSTGERGIDEMAANDWKTLRSVLGY